MHYREVVNGEEMSGGNLKNNIEEACKSLSNGLESMDMGRKMKLCRDLIEKVVVKKHDVKIHYKFPVSSNFNIKRECQHFHTVILQRGIDCDEKFYSIP